MTRTYKMLHNQQRRAKALGRHLDYDLERLRQEVEAALSNGCPYCHGDLTPGNFSGDFHSDDGQVVVITWGVSTGDVWGKKAASVFALGDMSGIVTATNEPGSSSTPDKGMHRCMQKAQQ